MSTRAQIVIKDGYEEVWFYRHSDGYPEGVLPTLTQFLNWVKEGKVRDNAQQSSGWLVVLGHNEYIKELPEYHKPEPCGDMFSWKVGAYEPCSPVEHGDIEFLYTVDLVKKVITYQRVHYNGKKDDPEVLI